MRINHVALWTLQLEELKEFYVTYFKGTSNEKYVNTKKGFESYFITFGENSAALEIMRRQDITSSSTQALIGLAHFSFSVGSAEKVIEFTEYLRKKGISIASEPRRTGDGFFESGILDPDGNLVEITI